MKIARHAARLLAIQSIYQWLLTNTSLSDAINYAIEQSTFHDPDKEYLENLVHGVAEQSDALTIDLSTSMNRKIHQLSTVEHAVLLIGIYELKNKKEIPFRVIIDEAVQAAKIFGTPEGYRFVNGVLDKLVEKFRSKSEKTKKI